MRGVGWRPLDPHTYDSTGSDEPGRNLQLPMAEVAHETRPPTPSLHYRIAWAYRIAETYKLGPTRTNLLVYIAYRADRGCVWEDRNGIGRPTQLGKRSVERVLPSLVKLGILRRQFRFGEPNTYWPQWGLTAPEASERSPAAERQGDATGEKAPVAEGGMQMAMDVENVPDDGADAQATWQAVLSELRECVPKPSFDTWFVGTEGVSLDQDTLVVSTPNSHVSEMLQRRMWGVITQAVEVTGRELEVRLDPEPTPEAAQPAADEPLSYAVREPLSYYGGRWGRSPRR